LGSPAEAERLRAAAPAAVAAPAGIVTVSAAAAEDAARWDAFVDGAAGATAYHGFGWKRVVEESFGHRTHYLQAADGSGRIRGVLPLVRLKSVLFGKFLVSMPFFNYGGICAEEPEVRAALLAAGVDIARAEGVSHLELRETSLLNAGLPVKTTKVCMRLALPGTAAELWGTFDAKLRSQVRRPGKEGMTARVGREEELDGFYRVFAANMRDLGTPVYSKRFFANILAAFPERSWIHTVYTGNGEPVASGFLLGHRETLEIPWASALRAFNRFSPNTLLYWSALSFACEHGYRCFDFGRSTPGEGTYRFKEQWGAQPVQLYWHYWLSAGGGLPELNPHNPRYQAAIRLWRRLPLPVTRVLGPAIVRNLP
jgi:FemAB-related protein (PEP-CTERM system-associated)